MKRLLNYLRGVAELTVSGPFPERLLNLCAQNGVEFWGVEWLDGTTLRLAARRRALGRLRELAPRAGCEVRVTGSWGLPDLLLRLRTRYAFWVGMSLSLAAVALLSRFVLTIQVTGNEKVPTAVILSQLSQLGVRPGVYGPALDRQQLAQEALLGLEGLSWMGINLHGTRLEVMVREEVEPPERLDESGYYDVVAETGGLILHIEAEAGQAAVAEGDTVAAGEVLISGLVTLEPPQYSDQPARYLQAHARGRVWARTWRTLTASIPLEAAVKAYTGEEQGAWSLVVLGRRIEIFGNSSISWPLYDKITTVRQAALPGGTALPLYLCRDVYRAYRTGTVQVDRQAARELLEDRLMEQLALLIGEEGEVVSTQFSAREEGGSLLVTLLAECREEIGEEVPSHTPVPNENNPGAGQAP